MENKTGLSCRNVLRLACQRAKRYTECDPVESFHLFKLKTSYKGEFALFSYASITWFRSMGIFSASAFFSFPAVAPLS